VARDASDQGLCSGEGSKVARGRLLPEGLTWEKAADLAGGGDDDEGPRLRFGKWTRRGFLAGCAMALAVAAAGSRGKRAETLRCLRA
jgi:hypothetical protein